MCKGTNLLAGSVVQQWGKTIGCYRSRQTLTSVSDGFLCLMRITQSEFLSDTTHCPMVTSNVLVVRRCRT